MDARLGQAGVLVQDLHVVRVVVSGSGTLGLLPGVDWVQVLQDAAESVILFQLTCGIVRGMGCVLGHARDLVALIAQNWTLYVEAGRSTWLFARTDQLLDFMMWHASSSLHPVFPAAHHLAAPRVLLLLRQLTAATCTRHPVRHWRPIVDLRATARLVIGVGRLERTDRWVRLYALVLGEATWVLQVLLRFCP